MYRLEIVTGRAGLPKESPIWKLFPGLFPCTAMYPRFFVVYGCTLEEPITNEDGMMLHKDPVVIDFMWDKIEEDLR